MSVYTRPTFGETRDARESEKLTVEIFYSKQKNLTFCCEVNLQMEDSKTRSNRLNASPNERKISRGLVRHVLTKNTNDRIALGKVTRQLDKERIAKELDFQQQKQKLLLQRFESQMKERSGKNGLDSEICNDSASQRLADLRIAASEKFSTLRCRSNSELEPSSFELRGSKYPVQYSDVHEGKDATVRKAVEKDRDRMRGATENSGRIAEDEKLKRTKTLSDILPPLSLPPIHKSSTSPLQSRKNSEIQPIKANAAVECHGVGTNQAPGLTLIDDLGDCRYLRKSKFS